MKRIKFEKIEIPEIMEEDLMETIYKSKEILRETKIIKKEPNTWAAIKKVVFMYGGKSIAIQGLLALFILIIGWIIVPEASQHLAMALLWMGGLIMSIAVCAELIHSDVYQMTELEKTCQFSPQRLLIWKMGLLSAISIVGLFIVAWVMFNKSGIKFYTLLCGGCIPFFALTGLTLQLRHHENILTNFILLYVIAIGVLTTLEINNGNQVLIFLDTFGFICLVASVGYCILNVIRQNKWGYEK